MTTTMRAARRWWPAVVMSCALLAGCSGTAPSAPAPSAAPGAAPTVWADSSGMSGAMAAPGAPGALNPTAGESPADKALQLEALLGQHSMLAADLMRGRIRGDDAWCEDPRDRHYNQPFRLDASAAGDRLKRTDHLYDLIIELDHNTRPRIAGRGSAVFVHVARPGFAPTAGCVALTAAALRRLISRVSPRTRIVVG